MTSGSSLCQSIDSNSFQWRGVRAAAAVASVTMTLFSGLLASAPASAQADYPNRPVTVVVSLPPGSGADTVARFLSSRLTERFKQPFVVENRPGANSFIASQAVANAAPDGYTMYVASNSPMTTNAVAFRKLPYDPIKDFAPVAMLARIPMAFVVSSGSPYKTTGDLVAALRRSPGKSSYGSGTATYRLAVEQFHVLNGVSATYVPYKGTSPALADVAAGTVEYTIADISAALPLVRAGKLRPLAVTAASRQEQLPGVPTMIESGNKDYEFYAWVAAFFPAKVDSGIVDKVAAASLEIMKSPEALAFLKGISGEAPAMGPRELAAFQREELRNMQRIADAVKMEKE